MCLWNNVHLWTEEDWMDHFSFKGLQDKCIEYELPSEGTKYELAERIISVFEYQRYSKPMEKFSGAYDQDIEKWLLDFEERADYWEWTQVERFFLVKGNLAGAARTLMSMMGSKGMTTYDKLRLVLLDWFGEDRSPSDALKRLIERRERLKAEKELLEKKRQSDHTQDLGPKKAEKEECRVEEEKPIEEQEDESRSGVRVRELQSESEDGVKKREDGVEAEEEINIKEESVSRTTENIIEKEVRRFEEEIQLQEEAENVDEPDPDVNENFVPLGAEIQQQNAKEQTMEDHEPAGELIEDSERVIKTEEEDLKSVVQEEDRNEEMEVFGWNKTEETTEEIADQMSEENYMSEEKFYEEFELENEIEEEHHLSVIKQIKEPEVEETDAEVEAFVEKKIEETRAKIESGRIEPEKVRFLCGFKADAAFILRYIDTGWMDRPMVDVACVVCYTDTGWREETEETAEGKIFEDAVIWVRSLVRRVV